MMDSLMPATTPPKPRILLVDDDREHVLGIRIRLHAAGYEVAMAHDGAAGMAAALAEPPAAIVLDMEMPLMDGLAVLAELACHDQTRQIPVIVLSGCVQRRHAALSRGVRYFLEKPCPSRILLQAVEDVVTYPTANGMTASTNTSIGISYS